MINFTLRLFIAFKPHLMVIFCLNSSLSIPRFSLTKCKEWTWSMTAMRGARLIQLTSRTISTLLFKGLSFWAICNAKMMATIFFFLMDVKMKQVGAVTLLVTLKGNYFVLSSPFCKICNNAFLCENLCVACMYYVMHKHENLTPTMIHLGMHDHPMAEGHSREFFKQVKSLVEHKVSCTLRATTSSIAFVANFFFSPSTCWMRMEKGQLKFWKAISCTKWWTCS